MIRETIPIMILSPSGDTRLERSFIRSRVIPKVQACLSASHGSLFVIDPFLTPVSDPDEIVDNCFSLIDRYRPHIIGILGEQYGCVFPEFSTTTFDRYTWMQEYTDRSITELEILYSAFIPPIPCRSASFYLKNSKSPGRGLREKQKMNNSIDAGNSYQKLENLKILLRSSGYTVREEFPRHRDAFPSCLSPSQSEHLHWTIQLEEWIVTDLLAAIARGVRTMPRSAIVF